MTTWVLLRGLAREQGHWGEFARLLRERLPAGDRVVALDLPGNGARWQEASPTRVETMVRALREQWRTMGHGGDCMLVALSLGGMAALQWAADAPLEVRGCVLVNTSLAGLSPFWKRLRPAGFAVLLRGFLSSSPRRRELAVLRATSNRPPDPEIVEAWTATAQRHPVRLANVLRQLLAAARFRAAARPRVPVLLLVSRGDRLVSPHCSLALARAWGVPLRAHPEAGHDLPLDDPPWLVDHIVRWSAGELDGPRPV